MPSPTGEGAEGEACVPRGATVSGVKGDEHLPASVRELAAMLDELLDVLGEVKQARWQLGPDSPLHDELDRLFADLTGAAQRIADRDRQLGGSLLAVRTTAGRQPPNLMAGTAEPTALTAAVAADLARLAEAARHHAAAAADDPATQDLLEDTAAILADHAGRLDQAP